MTQMVRNDLEQVCPSCKRHAGVEVIYLAPLDERVSQVDRRRNNLLALCPSTGDRRKSGDRRKKAEWGSFHANPDSVTMTCLACEHEWKIKKQAGFEVA